MKNCLLLSALAIALFSSAAFALDEPASGLGGRCGGGTFPSPYCAVELTCLKPTHPMPGQSGVCVPIAYVGERCGGAIRYPAQCAPNAVCEYPQAHLAGRMGVCKEVFSKVGEECGGGIRAARSCEEGLVCFNEVPEPGAKGICVKPVE